MRTWPRSGCAMPAIILSVCDLPAPEGPNRATRNASIAKRTFTSKRESPCRNCLNSATSQIIAVGSSALRQRSRGEASRGQQNRDARNRSDNDQEVGDVVLSGLHRLVNRDRERLRLSGDAAGDHQRRTEL